MSENLHYMIDFETLATTPDAKVLTLGVAAFNSEEVVASYHWNFNHQGPDQEGRRVTKSTLDWWDMQKTENPKAWLAAWEPTTSNSLAAVMGFLLQISPSKGMHAIWSRGTDFDIPILRDILEDVGLEAPFPFWAVADVRTFLVGKDLPTEKAVERMGEAHDAESDAVYQAESVIAAAKHYNVNIDDINKR